VTPRDPAWSADAEYMVWAKLHSDARFNLATSANVPLRELPFRPEDLELTGPGRYGYPPLVEALAAHARVPAENVVAVSGGTSMANHLALAALLEPGDEAIVESPTYTLLPAVVRYLGAAVVALPRRPEDGYAIDASDVRRRLSPRTRVVVLTNLHNPTSVFARDGELAEVRNVAREAGIRVLVDEVYLDAAFEDATPTAFHLGPEVVVTSSLTKVYGLSGLRCGWILADADLARALWRLNDLFGVNAPPVTDRLAVLALARLPAYRERARAILSANRPLLDGFLAARDDLEAVRTRHGTTVFPRLRAGSVDALCGRLRERYATSVVPGRFFGAPAHFRIGIGGDTSMVEEGLGRLAEALDEGK
jgi:aspartate/methionine/tyrosine aminotransferase